MTRSAISIMNIPGATFPGKAIRFVANLAKALKHRREIMNLAEFDDRMLKDIGLMRSDVDGALAEPFLNNPSLVLVRCAERHTRAEKAASAGRTARPVVPMVTKAACCA